MAKLKVMTVFGTRPEAIKMCPLVLEEAIKMCPLVLEMRKHPDEIEPLVAVTAQHREMLDQVLHLFGITPDYDLNIMSAGQTLYDVTEKPCAACRRFWKKLSRILFWYMAIPLPLLRALWQEMNRKLTGALADYHFAPTATSKANLLRENVPEAKIVVTGNTVIDALKTTVKKDYRFDDDALHEVLDSGKRLILMTTHRRENLGEPMRHVYKALCEVLRTHPGVEAIFPVHKNPKVRQIVDEELGHLPQVHLIEPLDYEPFANLMARVDIVLTDSGGIQEEAPALGKPVLVLRDTTERPEAVSAGTVKLIGTAYEDVLRETNLLLDDAAHYRSMAEAVNPYGDGEACARIVNRILKEFGFDVEDLPEFTVI